MLNLKGNLLSGDVKGMPISGMINISATSALLPGIYDLTPPLTDPVFGVVVTAVPASARAVSGWSYDLKNVMVTSYSRSAVPAGAFILTERPVPGRSGLVMNTGFGTLTSALKIAGGGQITLV